MATRFAHHRGGRAQALPENVVMRQWIGHLNELGLMGFNVASLKATFWLSWRKSTSWLVWVRLNFVSRFLRFLDDFVVHMWKICFFLSNSIHAVKKVLSYLVSLCCCLYLINLFDNSQSNFKLFFVEGTSCLLLLNSPFHNLLHLRYHHDLPRRLNRLQFHFSIL